MIIDHIPITGFVRDEIKLALKNRNLPHASLLTGQDGGAQLALALFIAKSILCASPQEGIACESCPACKKVEKLIHPDLNLSFPVIASRETADNALVEWREMVAENPWAGISDWYDKLDAHELNLNISAKECNRIEQTIKLKSFEGVGKVLIIWLPEFLGGEGNKLLKSIEEPPPGTHILLVSNDAARILSTIISRCRVFRISRPGLSVLRDWLVDIHGAVKNAATNAAAVSEGNINAALSQLSRSDELSVDRDFLLWSRVSFAGRPDQILDFVEDFLKSGGKEKMRNLFRFGIFYFNQVLRKRLGMQMEGLSGEINDSIGKMAAFTDTSTIERITTGFEGYLYQIDRNASTKILLTYATIQLGRDFRRALQRSREGAQT